MAALLATVGVALSGCSASAPGGDGPLEALDTGGAGVVVQNVQHEPTWAVSGFTACVRDTPGDFKVTKVQLVEPSGDVRVDGALYFGDEPGAEVKPGRLPANYLPTTTFDGNQIQATPCTTENPRVLAVGIEVTSQSHWEAKGVSMAYTADGAAYEVRWDLDIRVCAVGPDDAQGCTDRPAA